MSNLLPLHRADAPPVEGDPVSLDRIASLLTALAERVVHVEARLASTEGRLATAESRASMPAPVPAPSMPEAKTGQASLGSITKAVGKLLGQERMAREQGLAQLRAEITVTTADVKGQVNRLRSRLHVIETGGDPNILGPEEEEPTDG